MAAETTDLTYVNASTSVWSQAEISAAIFCASLAGLKPLIRYWTGHYGDTSTDSKASVENQTPPLRKVTSKYQEDVKMEEEDLMMNSYGQIVLARDRSIDSAYMKNPDEEIESFPYLPSQVDSINSTYTRVSTLGLNKPEPALLC